LVLCLVVQGKHLFQLRDADAPSVAIIQHPDVRRQLMIMKVYTEGMRSLIYYTGICFDRIKVSEDETEREKYQGILDVLIPIAKGYVTDRAFEICSHGVQVFGGYGYVKEYPVEQLLRDCRITLIYEGTNGIQAMDLLGRKLGMKNGKPVMDLFGEIQKTIAAAKEIEALQDLTARVEKSVNKLGEVALHLGATAMSPDALKAFSFAHPFMEAAGDVIMAWMLLWRAVVAAPKLEKIVGSLEPEARIEKAKKDKNAAFYEGQLKSAEFFAATILPQTIGKFKAIADTCGAAIDIPDASFGG